MLKHILLGIFPAMLPTLILYSIIAWTLGGGLSYIITLGIIASLANPITYILAIILGYTSHAIDHIGKRILIQTLIFSGGITVVAISSLIIEGKVSNQLEGLTYAFIGLIVLGFILSLIDTLVKKAYFKFFPKNPLTRS